MAHSVAKLTEGFSLCDDHTAGKKARLLGAHPLPLFFTSTSLAFTAENLSSVTELDPSRPQG